MPEYIEREKLQEHFKSVVSKHEVVINGMVYPVYLCDHTLHEIRNAPTEDVVKVVRCKDCKHYIPKAILTDEYDNPLGYDGICDNCDKYTDKDDFCSYGELKEREG